MSERDTEMNNPSGGRRPAGHTGETPVPPIPESPLLPKEGPGVVADSHTPPSPPSERGGDPAPLLPKEGSGVVADSLTPPGPPSERGGDPAPLLPKEGSGAVADSLPSRVGRGAGGKGVPKPRIRWRRQVKPTVLWLMMAIGSIPILIPFYWMLLNSVQSRDKTDMYPPQWLPVQTYWYVNDASAGKREVFPPIKEAGGKTQVRYLDGDAAKVWVPSTAVQKVEKVEPRWETYRNVFAKTGDTAAGAIDESKPINWLDLFKGESFGRYALNTLLIALLCVFGQVISCSLVAYGFARMRFWGRNVLFMLMLATMMIPAQIYAIPAFMIYKNLGWVDTYLPLILPAWLGGAFFVFLFRQFFMGIPLEMDEAARMDGAGPFKIWWEILLPMARPVAVVTAVYTAFGAWNDLFGPLIYINSDYKRTLALALTKFSNSYGLTDVPSLMAASALMMLPVLIIFFLSQRTLQQGMVVSGVKG